MRPKASRVGDKGETSVNSRGPRHQEWETRGRQVCGRRHPEWDESPETEAESCGPGMQPFERSNNPIQVSLFGEQTAAATHGHPKFDLAYVCPSQECNISIISRRGHYFSLRSQNTIRGPAFGWFCKQNFASNPPAAIPDMFPQHIGFWI